MNQTWVGSLGRIVLAQRLQSERWAWLERQGQYLLWDAYYRGEVYDALDEGGYRDEINRRLGGAAAADLVGLYNPVRAVVDLYLNVFAGAFGDEIQVEPTGSADARLGDAIAAIWKTSNLTIRKQDLCRIAARAGCAGLRIVADPVRRHVYLKVEHPRIIRDVEQDARGNVIAIQLEYDLTTGLAEQAQTITIREELTKTEFRTWRVEGGSFLVPYDVATHTDSGPGAVMPNVLGVVPYVLLYHTPDDEAEWGMNAFTHVTPAIDRLNALMSHIGIQVHRTVRAKWLVAASGAAPQEFDLGDMTIAYVDQRTATSPPMMAPLIAQLDLTGAIAQARLQLELIEDRLPELKATQGRYLSGQSGETIAALRKPAEDAVLLARTNYEDALIRAQQIALSWGVLLGLWDIGTGVGTREAAEQAYAGGYEDHRFNKRPALGEAPMVQPAQSPASTPMPTATAVRQSDGGAPQ